VRVVSVRNVTRGSMLPHRAELAQSPPRRFLGLMGRRGWAGCDGLLIRPCNAIHTLFMRTAIDVVFVDRAGALVDVVPERPPWRLGPLVWRARWVLELPPGVIAASATRLDDRLVVGEADAPSSG
jgi:uncharacterized membrane protein (UPF0127 family)